MIKVSEIAFSCYPVTDMARSRAFYVDCLGYLLSGEEPGALYLRAVEKRNHHSIVLR